MLIFFHSLDRIVSRLEDQSVDEDLHHLPDQPGSVVCSLRTNQPGFFVSIFSSLISGNEVFNFISNFRHHWNKTRIIGNIN